MFSTLIFEKYQINENSGDCQVVDSRQYHKQYSKKHLPEFFLQQHCDY